MTEPDKAPWVAASERSPDDGADVLAWWGDHVPMAVATFNAKRGAFADALTLRGYDAEPTRWMPLPPQPGAYLAQDQPQAEPLTIADESGTEHLTERGQNMMTRTLMRSAKRATPAAEPDVERRIRELAEGACGALVCHAFIEDALRIYGAEQRAAEREACVKAGKALAVSDETPERKGWNAALAVYAAAIRSRHD